jgi:signal transduction histidine kinase
MEDTDLSGIVTGEALAFESLAYENGRTLRTGVEDGIRVSGDRTQLQQLVSVLLDNAVRHSSGGEISVSLGREGRSAVLRVENEGEIPQEKLGRLFDRFYRADEARSSEGDHYGLGLSIAKAVAERHGGTVRAACRDGKVEFTAVLPVRKQTGQGASGG